MRVVAYALVCFATLGVQYSYSPIYALLLEELQTPPAATAFVGSLSVGLMDGLGPISGLAIERFGPRRTCIAGSVICGGGMMASAAASELWHFYFTYGLIVGVGTSLSFMAPIVLMNRWFKKRLALSHAAGNMGSALTPLAFGPASTPLFASLGRRTTMLCLGGLQLVLLLGASLLLTPPTRKHTADSTLSFTTVVSKSDEVPSTPTHEDAADDDATQKSAGQARHTAAAPTAPAGAKSIAASLAPFRAALRHRVMRLTMLTVFCYGLGAWIPIVHLVRIARECGLPAAEANSALVFMAVGSFTLRVPVACAADRFGRLRVFAVVCLLYASVCLAAALSAGTPHAGVCVDAALPLPTSNASHARTPSDLAPTISPASSDVAVGGASWASAGIIAFAYSSGLTGALNSVSVSLPSEIGLPTAQARVGSVMVCTPLGLGFLIGPVVGGALHELNDRYLEPLLFSVGMIVLGACFALFTHTLSMAQHQPAAPAAVNEGVVARAEEAHVVSACS